MRFSTYGRARRDYANCTSPSGTGQSRDTGPGGSDDPPAHGGALRAVVSVWVEADRSFGDRGERFRLRLARLLPLLRFARNDLRRWLESRGVPAEVVSDTTLAFSEACANAIEHASRPTRQLVEIEAQCDAAQLLVRIRDYGAWREQVCTDARGRGLGMIEQLMDAVDITGREDGTEIVMRRQLPGPST